MYISLAALGLGCCTWPSLFVASGVYSLGLECSLLNCCGFSLRSTDSVIVVQRLSCLMACGVFSDQGLNPCPLHWQGQADS